MNFEKELYELYQRFNILDEFIYNKLRDNEILNSVCHYIDISNCSIYFHTYSENMQKLNEGTQIRYVKHYRITVNVMFHFSKQLVEQYPNLIKKIKRIFDNHNKKRRVKNESNKNMSF